MQPSLYVGLSGQIAMQRRLDTIAANIANASTVGYRAEAVTFSSLVSDAGSAAVAFASAGASFVSRRSGELVHTANPLDLAVNGEAWFGVQTPAGPALTRDGRLRLTPEGELQTVDGFSILDPGGAPIRLTIDAGPPSVSSSGAITQQGRQVGSIGLFLVPSDAVLTRQAGGAFVSNKAPIAAIDPNGASVSQGYVERSNVNPMEELTKLIQVQRTFDAVSEATHQLEQTFGEALRALGGGS